MKLYTQVSYLAKLILTLSSIFPKMVGLVSLSDHINILHTLSFDLLNREIHPRSANNGISAIINPTGAILDKIDIDNEGVISIKKIKKVNKTLFSKFGNKIYFLIILLYIFLIFSFKKIKMNNLKKLPFYK